MWDGHAVALTGWLEAGQAELTVLHRGRNGALRPTRHRFCASRHSLQPSGLRAQSAAQQRGPKRMRRQRREWIYSALVGGGRRRPLPCPPQLCRRNIYQNAVKLLLSGDLQSGHQTRRRCAPSRHQFRNPDLSQDTILGTLDRREQTLETFPSQYVKIND
jgi:hypothetical protein